MIAKFPSETVRNTITVGEVDDVDKGAPFVAVTAVREYDLSEVDAYLESTICLLSEIKDRDYARFETFSSEERRNLLTIFTIAGVVGRELDKRMTGDR